MVCGSAWCDASAGNVYVFKNTHLLELCRAPVLLRKMSDLYVDFNEFEQKKRCRTENEINICFDVLGDIYFFIIVKNYAILIYLSNHRNDSLQLNDNNAVSICSMLIQSIYKFCPCMLQHIDIFSYMAKFWKSKVTGLIHFLFQVKTYKNKENYIDNPKLFRISV